MTNKIIISWAEFHEHTQQLQKNIQALQRPYCHIVAVSRGGLVPAGILAYAMDIRNCDVINMSSYDEDAPRLDTEVELNANLQNVTEQTLIVDDLSDSGRTFNTLRKLYPQATFACVYAKEKGRAACDVFAKSMPDEWIVFPWD